MFSTLVTLYCICKITLSFVFKIQFVPPVNGLSMGAQFSSATLDDATVALIKRKTRMKSSEITDWFNELKVRTLRVSLPVINQ
jgi:hypothetical protein